VASHLTRKELKQDKFAVEVEHTVDFFAKHRSQIIRLGGIVVGLLLVIAAIQYYRSSQHAVRQQALAEALALQQAPVGTAPPSGGPSFPSDTAKRDAVSKAFNKLRNDYGGSDEAYIAEYYLASMDADSGKMDDARKKYQDVADHASKNYASLARLALAQLAFAEGRTADGEKLAKELIDHPTDLVSKDQATITLAKGIAPTRPADARKLLQPLASQSSEISQVAVSALSDLPAK
jgi:predicted negative regulator of RcsB-dependent stress response